jgi:hypothetical protein
VERVADGHRRLAVFVLINEMLRYLVDTAGIKLNYLAGETAVLPNNPDRHPDRYQLFTPLGQPQESLAADGRVVVRFTEYPGAYRLKGYRDGPVVRGFSVNFPESASRCSGSTARAWTDCWAPTATTSPAIATRLCWASARREGFEFYPWLICLVALVLGMEQLLANRFYRKTE